VASLAVGVSLVLFLVFESRILGDPALRTAGRRASPERIGAERLRLGQVSEFETGVLRVEADCDRELQIQVAVAAGSLVLQLLPDGPQTGAPLEGRSVAEVAAALDGRVLAPGVVLRVRPDSLAAGARPAAGIGTALAGTPAVFDDRGGVRLGWARAVPAPRRFLLRASRLLRFDFGESWDSRRPIGPELLPRALRSLALGLPAFTLTTVLALGLALLAAGARGRTDRTLAWLSAAGMAISVLVWIVVLRALFVGELKWFPAAWDRPYAAALVLPALIWVAAAVWPELRYYRTVVLEEMGREYVQAARARGLGTGAVLRRHVLPNVRVPVLAQSLAILPFLALGSLLLERVFAIPGLGGFAVDAVFHGDEPVLQAVSWCFALLYLASQWLADLGYPLADPRMRKLA